MGGRGSGGHNRRSVEEHRLRGTYRPQRHDRAEAVLPDAVWQARANMAEHLERAACELLEAARNARTKGQLQMITEALQCLDAADRLRRGLVPGPAPKVKSKWDGGL